MDFSDYAILGVIPARYGSTRFPGKPLVLINGISMIERVYRQASLCPLLTSVVVATDDQRIYDHVIQFGGRAVMTSPNHKSGTDRIPEVLDKLEEMREYYHIVVNIQGDEPFIHPSQITDVINLFHNMAVDVATLIKKIDTTEDLFNPNVVKATIDKYGKVLYFSRSPIPYVRDTEKENWVKEYTFYKHVGIYAYFIDTLKQIMTLPDTQLEHAESLEQLRWLHDGFGIYTKITDIETIGIDTPEDLTKLINIS